MYRVIAFRCVLVQVTICSKFHDDTDPVAVKERFIVAHDVRVVDRRQQSNLVRRVSLRIGAHTGNVRFFDRVNLVVAVSSNLVHTPKAPLPKELQHLHRKQCMLLRYKCELSIDKPGS